jgi:hypothetical protein
VVQSELDHIERRAQIVSVSHAPKSFVPHVVATDADDLGAAVLDSATPDSPRRAESGKIRAHMAYITTQALLSRGETAALTPILRMAATEHLCEPLEMIMWLRASAHAMFTTPEWRALREAFVLLAARVQLDATRELLGLEDETLKRKYAA